MLTPTIIYTDGACKGNGKSDASAGGWGVFITYPDGSERHLWGGEENTTNNRMELMAAIKALEVTDPALPIQLFTDSNYVKEGISKWIHGWKNRGWKKSDGTAVLNQALWQQLDDLSQHRVIDWQWLKGHAGHQGNEMADALANKGVTSHGDTFVSPSQNNAPMPTSALATSDMPMPSSPTINTETPMQHDTALLPAYDGDTSRANPYFIPTLPEPINRGALERQLIMDTETTGFDDQNGDRIVEVGMIEMVGRKFTGEKLHVYLNPEKHMDAEVIKVHGISNEFVADKPKFADVAKQIYEFVKGAQLVAHNASFDMRFLSTEFAKAGFTDFAEHVSVLDTLALAKQLYPGQKNSLDALVKRLDVGKKDRTFHGALLDSEILAEVYLAMTGGQVSLDIDEEVNTGEEVTHQSLAHLAHLLTKCAIDTQADHDWRANVLK